MIFSIIIPYKTKDFYVERCLKWLSYQVFKDFEIIEVPDTICDGYPSEKRNWAILRAKGDFLAYLDSDSYPSADWLSNALKHLKTGYFIGVCGSGILPADAPLLEQAADLVLKWLPYSYRVTPKPQRIVPEFPTFNLIVKKTDLLFEPYLTGEDSLYCRKLSERGKILYSPDVIVYHNRRPIFKPFWKQIATYGLHRGHLIRLTVMGWVTTIIIYAYNFFKGFFKKKL